MPVKFDPSISMGHLMTAVSMLATLGVGYGVHTTTVNMLQENAKSQSRMIELHTDSIHALETSQVRTETQLQYIARGIDELKVVKLSK
jgi:ABC-type uncharacterized transport system fused permease/ATPase subunit